MTQHPWLRALVLSVSLGLGCHGKGAPPPAPIGHATLAITHVRVFDGTAVIPDADVVVDGDRLVAVGHGLALPAGLEVVDGAGRTLLPGLIDAHVHVHDGAQLEQSLAFGVTTVLDMFAEPTQVQALRAEARADRADLRSAGTLATAPGGHGTEYGIPIPTISTPAEAQAFVDARFAEGSDYLKIVFDDGSAYDHPIPSVDAATLRALIEAAHARGKLAVVHIGDHEEARTAIEAGADGLVHLFRDAAPAADFGAVVARHHAFVTPTLTVLRTLQGGTSPIGADPALAPYLDPAARANLTGRFKLHATATAGATEAAIAQLRAAGVPILCGTDAPNPGTTHGASVHDELALLVAAGLPPLEALAAATSRPAERFALTDRGRIAAGLRADLVLVDGDPTTTITDSRRIVTIWRGGAKLDRAAYAAKVAEQLRIAAAPVVLGPISDFEDGAITTKFGQPWQVSTDAIFGGSSKATIAVVDGGASGAKAMAITGEVIAGGRGPSWAGAMFSPGKAEFEPTDLSSKPRLTFQARGDGKAYLVMVFARKLGRTPAIKTFTPGQTFAPVTFAWTDFTGVDGTDIEGIFIGQAQPGRFELVVDDLAVR